MLITYLEVLFQADFEVIKAMWITVFIVHIFWVIKEASEIIETTSKIYNYFRNKMNNKI